MKIKYFVDEADAVTYVSKELKISYNEAENLYSELGGYQGHSISFSTRWPNDDAFSVCIQNFMHENGIEALQLQYDD